MEEKWGKPYAYAMHNSYMPRVTPGLLPYQVLSR